MSSRAKSRDPSNAEDVTRLESSFDCAQDDNRVGCVGAIRLNRYYRPYSGVQGGQPGCTKKERSRIRLRSSGNGIGSVRPESFLRVSSAYTVPSAWRTDQPTKCPWPASRRCGGSPSCNQPLCIPSAMFRSSISDRPSDSGLHNQCMLRPQFVKPAWRSRRDLRICYPQRQAKVRIGLRL